MEKSENDIEKFDLLENSQEAESLSDELKSIKSLDNMMVSKPSIALSEGFTSSVVRAAIIAKRKKANARFYGWLFGIVSVMILALTLFSWQLPVGESSGYSIIIFNELDGVLEFFFDPRFKQLFIILESILCLLFVERLLSRFGTLKPSAH